MKDLKLDYEVLREVENYHYGFLRMSEVCEHIAQLPSRDGQIVRAALDEVLNSEEYQELYSDYRKMFSKLCYQKPELTTVIDYYRMIINQKED